MGRSTSHTGRPLGLLAFIATVAYLIWRTTTLNHDALVFSIVFLALEVLGTVSFALFLFSTWDRTHGVLAPVQEAPGKVAIFVTTYDEDEDLLLPTISAAVNAEIPHETWVLDDGCRRWVAELCESVGANYIDRESSEHAKAGNLNAALSQIDADFIAILDADHVPKPDFLSHTLGYFADPRVALVQTPQDFYNVDSFEHVGSYEEEALFYRVLQPGKNRWNAAFWCGTSAVLRTTALKEVGGVAVESLTEDLHTTLRLHRNGWKTVFHNEVLARGIAPRSYREYAVQRQRWAAGAMQILRTENPIFGRDLTVPQRLAYAATFSGWFEGIRTLGLLAIGLTVLFTGWSPVLAPPYIFFGLVALIMVLQQLSMRVLSDGRHQFLATTMFDWFRLPSSTRAVGRFIAPNGVNFAVTPKGKTGNGRERGQLPRLLAGLMMVILIAWAAFAANWLGYTPIQYDDSGMAQVALLFTVLQAVSIMAALERATSSSFASERRGAYRFSATKSKPTRGAHENTGESVRPTRLVSISVSGAVLELSPEQAAHFTIDETVQVQFSGSVVLATIVSIEGLNCALAFANDQSREVSAAIAPVFESDQDQPVDEQFVEIRSVLRKVEYPASASYTEDASDDQATAA